jgi:hypothetical protein
MRSGPAKSTHLLGRRGPAVLVAALLLAGCNFGSTLDPKIPDLEKAVSEQVGTSVTVTCPSNIPLKQGQITDCVASDSTGRKYLRVTQDDDQGHYHWELTSQDAP